MTTPLDETALRHWLTDYLVTTVGCSPDDVDPEASFNDLGVGSTDAVVLSGELSELLGRSVSPVEFWQHPTIDALAGFLSAAESEPAAGVPDLAVEPVGAGDEPIAVIGLGCRFPGDIRGPEQLWDFLRDGRSAVGEVPPERWAPFDDGSPEVAAALARTTRWGSFLSDVDAFDADFFEILPREAAKMDPQQRLLLEVAWEALEHAGTPPASLRHSQTGVFVGACLPEYGFLSASDLPGVDAWSNTGGALSIIANRLSYFLDLRGPSFAVDTACSSSLVAVHLACQSLRTGDSKLALAAGVNLLLSPAVFHGFDQAGALSPTGRCRAFDADADGFVRGEGCGVVVLKRLSDAQRDGDRVLAVVRGSAVNQDGRSNGLMAPNPAAQMAVLRSAYANARVQPHAVDYVETHGTGTLLGDPIEARALGTVLGRGRPEQSPLMIGSVKSNLGHLEAAAGVAGLLKAVLALQHGAIPGNLHFHNPNPHIPFDQLRLEVVDGNTDWPATDRPRCAGVSSFGFGGTNAHLVLEQAPEPAVPDREAGEETVPTVSTLVVSGKTPERISSTAQALADWMTGDGQNVPLAEVAHTLNHHRVTHPTFATVCARDRGQAVTGLRALAAGREAPGVVPPHEGRCGQGTVFVYSGQGSQWTGMGRRLLAEEPVFAAAIADLEPAFVEEVGFSLRQVLAEGQPVHGDARVQPVVMGMQLALTELWRSHGVQPDAVIGHSMGEVSAAVVAGALSASEGLQVIAARARLMSRQAGQGAVALLKLDAADTAAMLTQYPGVAVAGHLSPRQTVVAGPPRQVDAVIEAVTAANRFARRVNMEVASHTEAMDAILPEIGTALGDLQPTHPAIPFLSTVADPAEQPVLDARYWMANVRRPVQFSRAVSAAAREYTTFIEVSPHPIMTQAITETLESHSHHHSIGTLSRDGDDTVVFHTNLNAAHTVRPPSTPHPAEPHVVLPATPWHHTRYWLDVVAPARRREPTPEPVAPSGDPLVPADWYYQLSWPVAALSENTGATAQSWLVLADDDGFVTQLGRMLAPMSRMTTLPPSVLEGSDDGTIRTALSGISHVLYAPRPAAGTSASDAGHRLFRSARRLVTAMSSAATVSRTPPPRLFVLTRNAQPIADGDRAEPAHAVLWGLGRTLALEHPEIWGGIIDIDQSVPGVPAARYVIAEAHSGDDEDQVVYRAGVRHVPRIQAATAPTAPPGELDSSASYLVVGATGNIGPHLIRQLADMGAAHIVAVSRSPGSRLQPLADELSVRGTTLTTVAADVTDEAAMGALFDRFGADLPALAGIYLAAFGGGPVTLRDMTDDQISAMFAPKLDAASVLHRLSLTQPVTEFVVFTSISGLLGSRWLAHYAATTTFLDTFVYARRAAGLPATAVNWGLWKSLSDGQGDEELRVTEESGLKPMPDEVAILALRTLTGGTAPTRAVVVAADWPRLAAAYRTRASLTIIDDLAATAEPPAEPAAGESGPAGGDLRTALRDSEPGRRRPMLLEHVTGLVAAVMGVESPQALDPAAGFFHYGMDSLMSVTLQRALSETLGVAVPASVVFDYPTIDALTDHLAGELPEFGADATASDPVGDLTEDELLQQLSDRLSGAR
ncbi:type I polyketide synthase [Mycolicibacterium baixiangningiae]|uniref:type I polyketide synthase n=1 Tax=Mycolicibacterium baixiangningiae TaxID=2761578 RepID=UPI0018669BFB|nr:type I polyketide synthase [Mycolicibacterium baixiangningiae]